MLAHVHRSAAKLNLDFDLLESEQELLRLKQLSFLYLVHLEQQSVNHDVKPLLLVQYLEQQGQTEVPVVQG
jgi:hypothetical protein